MKNVSVGTMHFLIADKYQISILSIFFFDILISVFFKYRMHQPIGLKLVFHLVNLLLVRTDKKLEAILFFGDKFFGFCLASPRINSPGGTRAIVHRE